MRIEEKAIVKAPIQDTWDFLLDPQKLASCMPGCEKVEILGNNSYLVTEAIKIGPISARFNSKVTIKEMTPPNYLLATMEGKDTKTSSLLSAKTIINLEPVSDNETEVKCVLDITLAGLLGKFGEGIIRKKADSLAEKFTENIRTQLESRPTKT